MTKRITKISAIITFIALISIYSSTAIASNGEGFTIMSANPNTENPRKFSFEVMPGTKTEDFVEIQNISGKEETFLLYGADPTFSAQGTPAYKTKQASGNGEGKWISFEEEEITMNPNEKRIVKFTLEIPQKISEGDYRAGITMEKTPKPSGQEGISITTRVILHAEIKVTNNPSQISNESTNNTTTTKNQTNWKEIYFWVSLMLFISSLIALLWITLINNKSKSSDDKATNNKPKTIAKKKPIKTVKKTTKTKSSPKKTTKKSTSTKKIKKK